MTKMKARGRVLVCVVGGFGIAAGFADGQERGARRHLLAEMTVSKLSDLLRSSDPDRRQLGAEELARRGPEAEDALADLARLLDDPADDVCVASVRAICSVGPKAAPFLPALVRMERAAIRSGKWLPEYSCFGVPSSCVERIGLSGVPFLIEELGVDPETDEVPENLLAALGPGVVPSVIQVLSRGGRASDAAAEVLWRLGEKAAPALPALVEAVQKGRISDSKFIFVAGEVGVADPDVLAELCRLKKAAETEEVRLEAESACRRLVSGDPGHVTQKCAGCCCLS